MNETVEPKEAFPYKPPTEEIRQKYRHIFELTEPLPPRFFKMFFDKLVAMVMLLPSAPILLLLKLAFLIEGWLIPENKGPMFFYYNAASAGKIIPKYKIRLIKTKYIEPEGAKRHDWIAYSAEWTSDSRTYVGQFVKKFYLDELPQFYSVLQNGCKRLGSNGFIVFFRSHAVCGGVTPKQIQFLFGWFLKSILNSGPKKHRFLKKNSFNQKISI